MLMMRALLLQSSWVLSVLLLPDQVADGFTTATVVVFSKGPRSSTTTTTPSSSATTSSSAATISSAFDAPPPALLPETKPLAPHTFAGMLEQALIKRFGTTAIDRVLTSWRLLDQEYVHRAYVGPAAVAASSSSSEATANADAADVTTTTTTTKSSSHCYQECHSYVPGLTVREFWNTTDFAWCHRLEEQYGAIRREFDAVTSVDPLTLQQKGNNECTHGRRGRVRTRMEDPRFDESRFMGSRQCQFVSRHQSNHSRYHDGK
jgi:hypothetical protein